MKKFALFTLSISCLFLSSIHALTVIKRDGTVYQTEPEQKSNYKAPSRKDYYDAWGRHEGHSEKGYGSRTTHYDSWGRVEGHSESDRYSGEVKHYDAWGRLQGSTRTR